MGDDFAKCESLKREKKVSLTALWCPAFSNFYCA